MSQSAKGWSEFSLHPSYSLSLNKTFFLYFFLSVPAFFSLFSLSLSSHIHSHTFSPHTRQLLHGLRFGGAERDGEEEHPAEQSQQHGCGLWERSQHVEGTIHKIKMYAHDVFVCLFAVIVFWGFLLQKGLFTLCL